MRQITNAISALSSALLLLMAGMIAETAEHQAHHYKDLIQPDLAEFVFKFWWLPWAIAVVLLLAALVISIRIFQNKIAPDQSNAASICFISGSVGIFVFYVFFSIAGFSKIWLYL